ncbi:MAG: HD domain-containing protein [Blautia sp.]|nr:HD domain-containing protein [Blautia sp.]
MMNSRDCCTGRERVNLYMRDNKEKEINDVLQDIKRNETVQKMKKYLQHGRITTYEHCEAVVDLSYEINRKLHLHANVDTLLKGAMLHDFYLYDWHKKGDGTHRFHGFRHAEKACRNAAAYFDVDENVRHVIRCHMWPLNPERLPRSREAWIVCIADKCVSLHETIFRR